jgi:diguanylate cyclase (GGDEF)-like protein
MDQRLTPTAPTLRPSVVAGAHSDAEGRLVALSTLVEDLNTDGAGRRAPTVVDGYDTESSLVQARLGIATSLYASLRWKHEPTAQHCLRTALSASGWAELMNLPPAVRDEIELAALLHDIGKIGVLDSILTKPGALNAQEAAIMECHWLMGEQILRGSCASAGVIDIVRYTRGWFDGKRGHIDRHGDDLPLGARMLAVVDAFDSMTTDHVFRRAMSVERAFDELYRCAGTQFDPDLVAVFSKLFESDPLAMQAAAARRWLSELLPEVIEAQWRRGQMTGTQALPSTDSMFQQRLIESMHDGVIFVDANLQVLQWNHGAERLTGIPGKGILSSTFLPSTIGMADEHQSPIGDKNCPLAQAVREGVQWVRRLHINGRGGRPTAVDAQAVPVVDDQGLVVGLTLQLHDVSDEISLEQRCQNLHDMATQDPMTKVANRAEFDRVLAEFVKAHRDTKRPCALIMTDIDRFKTINDTYGHQAGDEVIKSIANMLKTFCRAGDLVARYGGEEFVLLCADCDNATAAKRAEEVRTAFSLVKHVSLGQRCVTASFGVTEIQPGDTPETMIRRADRALFQAKETGRNRVVQLGVGGDAPADETRITATSKKRLAGNMLLKREMTSDSPLERNIEKLKGFVADHHAEILLTDRNRVQLRIGGDRGGPLFKRQSDRTIRLIIDLAIHEESFDPENNPRALFKRTRITAMISPVKSRERRTAASMERARQLVASLRSYLMATDVDGVEAVTEDAGGGLWQSVMSLFGGGTPALVGADDRE